jgi:pyruvate/2-oxoglutarate dehydrogenase complex dihydrolipoamide dehydrogenase (E3) component
MLMVAAGRVPNVEGMNLEAAGVQYNERGIIIDDKMRTTNSDIYAVGDCCFKYQFTHIADKMARMVIKNALYFGKERLSSLIIPWCTYTEPEVAHVGLYTHELDVRGHPYAVYTKYFDDNDRSI